MENLTQIESSWVDFSLVAAIIDVGDGYSIVWKDQTRKEIIIQKTIDSLKGE